MKTLVFLGVVLLLVSATIAKSKKEKEKVEEATEEAEEAEGTEDPEKAEGTEDPEKAEGTEKSEKAHGTEKSEKAHGTEKSEKAEGTEKPEEAEDSKNTTSLEDLSARLIEIFKFRKSSEGGVNKNSFHLLDGLRSSLRLGSNIEKVIKMEDEFNAVFDDLTVQKNASSEGIGNLITDFENHYIEKSVEIFEKYYAKVKKMEDDIEKLANETLEMVNAFGDSLEECVNTPREEFRDLFDCRKTTRNALMDLPSKIGKFRSITSAFKYLPEALLDNKKTTLNHLSKAFNRDLHQLFKKITRAKNRQIFENVIYFF